jgi:hypothetical protein
VRGLDELPPLDLVVLGPHVRVAPRESLHLPRKIDALELKKRSIELSPPRGVHGDCAQAEERSAALQERLTMGMRIAAFVDVEGPTVLRIWWQSFSRFSRSSG